MNTKNRRMWCLSLLVISSVTLILSVSNIVGIELPDVVVRTMGILDIVALPVLVYTSIKRKKES